MSRYWHIYYATTSVCVVLCCVACDRNATLTKDWHKDWCYNAHLIFSLSQFHTTFLYVNCSKFTRTRLCLMDFLCVPAGNKHSRNLIRSHLSKTILADRWTKLQAIEGGGKQHAWWDKEGHIWLTSFCVGAAVLSVNLRMKTYLFGNVCLLQMSCFIYCF